MKQYIVKPGKKVALSDWDPNDISGFPGAKEDAIEQLKKMTKKLESLQNLLYAEHKHKLLIVLQAMDTAGKDGTIRHVFEGVNPQGVRVVSYKMPTAEELDHDYLWRVHKNVPGKGEMVIFNRSHYEDVLIVRVHQLVPEEVWRKRYQQINNFERMLSEEGTTILKFYLNIDELAQKERLEARLEDPSKNWKFNVDDLKERKLWPDYMKAYEDALSETGTKWAPWTIVPSNHKWFRNLVISTRIVETLESLAMEYPKAEAGDEKLKIV